MNHAPAIESNGTTTTLEEIIRLKTILVPIDFSAQSKFAFRYAAHLAESVDGRIILLHVVQSPFSYRGYEPEVEEELTRQAQHNLDQMCLTAAIKLENIETMVRLEVESISKEIVLAARDVEADLIVVPASHRSGFTRALVTSTADSISHHAPCPVLTIPAA
jgi:nucleotide-binding universal stress UspA family protein